MEITDDIKTKFQRLIDKQQSSVTYAGYVWIADFRSRVIHPKLVKDRSPDKEIPFGVVSGVIGGSGIKEMAINIGKKLLAGPGRTIVQKAIDKWAPDQIKEELSSVANTVIDEIRGSGMNHLKYRTSAPELPGTIQMKILLEIFDRFFAFHGIDLNSILVNIDDYSKGILKKDDFVDYLVKNVPNLDEYAAKAFLSNLKKHKPTRYGGILPFLPLILTALAGAGAVKSTIDAFKQPSPPEGGLIAFTKMTGNGLIAFTGSGFQQYTGSGLYTGGVLPIAAILGAIPAVVGGIGSLVGGIVGGIQANKAREAQEAAARAQEEAAKAAAAQAEALKTQAKIAEEKFQMEKDAAQKVVEQKNIASSYAGAGIRTFQL